MKKLRESSSLILHPFFFAVYPTLAVLAGSLGILNPIQAVRPFVLILLITASLFLVFFFILKDAYRAGFILSILIFMLLYYGYSYKLPREISILGFTLSRHLLILLFWAIFLPIVFSKWVWERVRPQVITRILNISSLIALLLPLRLIAVYILGLASDPLATWQPPDPPTIPFANADAGYKPDIYYLIVDGYGREDVLREYYGFDNSHFINFLEGEGFYVADKSTSNYIKTAFSLSSSLNFEYLDYLSFAADEGRDFSPLTELTIHSKARYLLEKLGYKIFISGEYLFSQISDPAIVFNSSSKKPLTIFESLLLETSMMEIIIDLGDLELSDYTYQRHQERILDGFLQIERLANIKGPKFIFAHIVAPHPPFVFDRDGNPIEPETAYSILDAGDFSGGTEDYVHGYVDQLIYINRKLVETILYILEQSDAPPVIVIQGDHGPAAYFDWKNPNQSCVKERFSILNAYYLPNNGNELYDTITPVNTYRSIFNAYFEGKLDLLEDRNYLSTYPNWYKFIEVTDTTKYPCNIESRSP